MAKKCHDENCNFFKKTENIQYEIFHGRSQDLTAVRLQPQRVRDCYLILQNHTEAVAKIVDTKESYANCQRRCDISLFC